MSQTTHTPGPWAVSRQAGALFQQWHITAPTPRPPRRYTVATVSTTATDPAELATTAADAALIAAAPEMLAELRETADWLTARAGVLRQLADQAPGVMRKRNEHLRQLRDEAARFEGRATVIRQTILKATQGA